MLDHGIKIHKDTLGTGWGYATLTTEAACPWEEQDFQESSNFKELKTILIALA